MKAKMKVIVTRPQPDADMFAAELLRIGANPIVSPVMVIRNRTEPVELHGVGAVVFTSANGVRAFAAVSGERRLKVFAVGEATGAAARAAGFSNIETAKGEVESLAKLIAAAKPTSTVLHLAGSERAGDLKALLSARGVAARRAVIYDAVEVENLSPMARRILAARSEKAAVVFFSPRSARLFLGQVHRAGLENRLRHCVALCLSAVIADALKQSAWKTVEVAADQCASSMLRLVEERLRAESPQPGVS